jgi:hypothetical protein
MMWWRVSTKRVSGRRGLPDGGSYSGGPRWGLALPARSRAVSRAEELGREPETTMMDGAADEAVALPLQIDEGLTVRWKIPGEGIHARLQRTQELFDLRREETGDAGDGPLLPGFADAAAW